MQLVIIRPSLSKGKQMMAYTQVKVPAGGEKITIKGGWLYCFVHKSLNLLISKCPQNMGF
jgi:hypothetical protein